MSSGNAFVPRTGVVPSTWPTLYLSETLKFLLLLFGPYIDTWANENKLEDRVVQRYPACDDAVQASQGVGREENQNGT